jgi:phytoene dehydrogenase-like protein
VPLPHEVDGIIIGGGHNGLIAANYLARAGARVLVLESQPHIGGGLSTEEITLPLFRHNLHVFFVRWTVNYRIWRDLQLTRYGLQTIIPEVQNAIPFRDGGALVTYNSIAKSVAAIRTLSPRDADTYARAYSEFQELVQKIAEPLRFAAPLFPDELQTLLSRSAPGRRYLALSQYAALDLVRELFHHEAVRALILFNVAVRGYLPVLDVPGTGYIVILALFASHHGALIQGGSKEAARALTAGVFAHGGQVVTNAKVERILITQDRATAVELSDGRRIRAAKFICSNVPSALTLSRMIDSAFVARDLRESATHYHWNEEAIIGVHLALREPPRYAQADREAPVQRALNYCIGFETSDDFVRDMAWIRQGIVPPVPALHAGVPTLFDPGQAPPGYATAFAWQFVPTRPAEGGPEVWAGAKAEQVADLMLAKWREYAPNLAQAELARGIHSPLDTARYIPSMVLGDRHHGSYHPDNFDANRPHPQLSRYRTPLVGLYHCGADSYPGGSFTGQPGYNAATAIAHDLGYEAWWHPQDPRDVLPVT